MGWPLSDNMKSDDTTTRSVDRIFFASTVHFTEAAASDLSKCTPNLIDVEGNSAVHIGASDGGGWDVANGSLLAVSAMDVSSTDFE